MTLHEKYFKGKLIGEGYFYKVYIIKDKIKQDFFCSKNRKIFIHFKRSSKLFR